MSASFPPVFVISLSGEIKRRTAMTAKLDALDIPFSFFDAVDGRKMDVNTRRDYDGARRRKFFGKDLTGGEMGCLLSHKGIFEKIMAEDLACALILEDDAVLSSDFKSVLLALQDSSIPYDIIRFLGSPKVARGPQRKIKQIKDNYWLVRLRNIHGGAHAYLITHAGAEKIYNALHFNAFPIDTLLSRSWQTGAEVLSVQPGLATQDLSFESSIGEIRHEKRFKGTPLQKLSFALNRGQYKIAEALGKHYIYWTALPRDKSRTNT